MLKSSQASLECNQNDAIEQQARTQPKQPLERPDTDQDSLMEMKADRLYRRVSKTDKKNKAPATAEELV